MKKLLLLAIVGLMAASCEKQGDELYMYSKDFEVLSGDWERHESDVDWYYYYTFRFDRLTRQVCDIGQVTATRYITNSVQSQLPEVRLMDDFDLTWTETIRYQYAPGEITFIVSYSDAEFFPSQPGTMKFRAVLNW